MARPLRAEVSDGERTTLRVPPDLLVAADCLADELGVTRNAALIVLARRGHESLLADAGLQRVRDDIQEAVLGIRAGRKQSPFPTPNEFADAILGPRGEELRSP